MSPHPISASAAWTAAGWTMLHLVWIGAAGGLAAAVLRRLLRPARPEIRHGVAVACLLALAAAPVILFALALPARSRDGAGPRQQAASTAKPDGRTTGRCGPATGTRPAPAGRRTTRRGGSARPVLLPVRAAGRLPARRLAVRLAGDARPARDRPGRRRTAAAVEPAAGGRCDRAAMPGAGRLARGRPARRRGDLRPDRRARPDRRRSPDDPPAARGARRLDHRAGRDGPAARAGPHPAARQPRHPLAAARGIAALLPPGDLVALGLGEPRARAVLRPARGRAHRPAASLRPDARGPGRRGRRVAIAGAGDGPAPADDTDPSNPGHGGPFDEDDPDRRARTARRRDGRHDVDTGDPRQAAGPVPADAARQALERLAQGVVAMPDGSRTTRTGQLRRQGPCPARDRAGPAQARRSRRGPRDAPPARRPGRAPPPKPGAKADIRAWAAIRRPGRVGRVRRDAGDLDGARAALDRAARYLEVLDRGAVRRAIERVGKEMDDGLASRPKDDPSG